MPSRVQLWPPGGGEPIEVYASEADALIASGWTTAPPPAADDEED